MSSPFTPIAVSARSGEPLGFRWRRSWHRVTAVEERWQDAGAWWADERPSWFYRVVVEGGGVFELVSDLEGEHWWLYRVYD